MTTANGHPSVVVEPERLPADLPTASARARLSGQLLDRMDRYWRAANHLSVGQLYLWLDGAPRFASPSTAVFATSTCD